jgi:hypothetical protein
MPTLVLLRFTRIKNAISEQWKRVIWQTKRRTKPKVSVHV